MAIRTVSNERVHALTRVKYTFGGYLGLPLSVAVK